MADLRIGREGGKNMADLRGGEGREGVRNMADLRGGEGGREEHEHKRTHTPG